MVPVVMEAGLPLMQPLAMLPAVYVAPQPAFWAPEAVYLTSLQEMILNQVHYYFSIENLCRDEFLRLHMDPEEGWITIQLLATFNRLRNLTTDVGLITEVRSCVVDYLLPPLPCAALARHSSR